MNTPNSHEFLHIYNEILYTADGMPNEQIQLKGDFLKKILIVVNTADFQPEQETLLIKMLTACKLAAQDYAILFRNNQDPLFALTPTFHPEVIIAFGIPTDTSYFKLDKPLNKPFRFGEAKVLLSQSLTDLKSNDTLKSELWTMGLKPLFGL